MASFQLLGLSGGSNQDTWCPPPIGGAGVLKSSPGKHSLIQEQLWQIGGTEAILGSPTLQLPPASAVLCPMPCGIPVPCPQEGPGLRLMVALEDVTRPKLLLGLTVALPVCLPSAVDPRCSTLLPQFSHLLLVEGVCWAP